MFGFAIHPRSDAASQDLLDRFRPIPVANISDVMSRMTAGGARLRPMHDGSPMIGVAVTVKTRPGDNLMIHHAMDISGEGDIIVVDAGGDLTNSLMGEMMMNYAASRGISGFVLDGAIRDADVIRQGAMPIFAAGVTHRGPYKTGPGEINCPIAIDGMVVQPGDIIMGDADGVLCIPLAHAEAILIAAEEKCAAEERTRIAIREGRLNRAWVREGLIAGGCILPDQQVRAAE
ncbi:RraA family protein [Falsirhodobacter xinxiangensis]|uniref:RraA family protein n=1 Tax=Falsirhodobacter xinxiangensis TaxID=2530049 RepID=UPI0010AB0B6E|nr:RraA family protein [Rhodobacter xinxiangensis]